LPWAPPALTFGCLASSLAAVLAVAALLEAARIMRTL
jgi:hypothetical protein